MSERSPRARACQPQSGLPTRLPRSPVAGNPPRPRSHARATSSHSGRRPDPVTRMERCALVFAMSSQPPNEFGAKLWQLEFGCYRHERARTRAPHSPLTGLFSRVSRGAGMGSSRPASGRGGLRGDGVLVQSPPRLSRLQFAFTGSAVLQSRHVQPSPGTLRRRPSGRPGNRAVQCLVLAKPLHPARLDIDDGRGMSRTSRAGLAACPTAFSPSIAPRT